MPGPGYGEPKCVIDQPFGAAGSMWIAVHRTS